MFGVDDWLLGSAAGAAASFFGGERRNTAQADQAASANAFSAQQFATRYQTTTRDMEAAGLNPMLAYSQGGGAPPSGQQAQMQDTLTPAVQSGTASLQARLGARKLGAEIENIESSTALNEAQAMERRGEAGNKPAQGEHSYASAAQARSQVGLNEVMFKEANARIANLPLEGNRIKAATESLAQQAKLAIEQGATQGWIRSQLSAAISKLNSENELLRLDISAADQVSNLGREAGQYKPVIDIIVSILRSMRR